MLPNAQLEFRSPSGLGELALARLPLLGGKRSWRVTTRSARGCRISMVQHTRASTAPIDQKCREQAPPLVQDVTREVPEWLRGGNDDYSARETPLHEQASTGCLGPTRHDQETVPVVAFGILRCPSRFAPRVVRDVEEAYDRETRAPWDTGSRWPVNPEKRGAQGRTPSQQETRRVPLGLLRRRHLGSRFRRRVSVVLLEGRRRVPASQRQTPRQLPRGPRAVAVGNGGKILQSLSLHLRQVSRYLDPSCSPSSFHQKPDIP